MNNPSTDEMLVVNAMQTPVNWRKVGNWALGLALTAAIATPSLLLNGAWKRADQAEAQAARLSRLLFVEQQANHRLLRDSITSKLQADAAQIQLSNALKRVQ